YCTVHRRTPPPWALLQTPPPPPSPHPAGADRSGPATLASVPHPARWSYRAPGLGASCGTGQQRILCQPGECCRDFYCLRDAPENANGCCGEAQAESCLYRQSASETVAPVG